MRKTVEEGIRVMESREGKAIFVEYEPGNCTKYPVLFTKLEEFSPSIIMSLGFDTAINEHWVMSLLWNDKGRSLMFTAGQFVHWTYIVEKTQILEGDARVLSDLIKHIFEPK